MQATGRFDVRLDPQDDGGYPAGRMLIDKTYHGDMEGQGVGQMISCRLDNGTAIYHAIEEFTGTVHGRSGAFTLVHSGRMSATSQSLEIEVLEGSGRGELAGLTGSMAISQDNDGHAYRLDFDG